MSFIGVPSGTPIEPTAIALPPMGQRVTSITYTIKATAGNTVRVYNPCGYTPSSQAENHPSFGVYTKILMALDIPLTVLANDQPKPGDFFTGPDGNSYSVIARQTASLYLCRVVGVCPTLSYALEDTVQYYSCSASGGGTGARTITDTPVGSPVAARVQPFTADLGEMFGTKDFEDYFMVYLAVDPSGTGVTVIQAGDYFEDQNSVIYEILEVMERDRLDFLSAFRCVKKL